MFALLSESRIALPNKTKTEYIRESISETILSSIYKRPRIMASFGCDTIISSAFNQR